MRSLLTLAAVAALAATPAGAQRDLPVVRSTVHVISIRDGADLRVGGWTLAPEARPDVYEAALIRGRPHRVTFLTDVDSIGFLVEEGKSYDFVIERGGVPHLTRIVGTRATPAATFDAAYRRANRGGARWGRSPPFDARAGPSARRFRSRAGPRQAPASGRATASRSPRRTSW